MVRRAIARMTTMATAIPTAALRNWWSTSATICEK